MTSNPNISKTISYSIINNTIFWKCATRTRPFRCIYVNCFNILRFLAEVSTKLQKMHEGKEKEGKRTITLEGNMENRQMTPFFYLLFSLKLFVTFISEFENTENSFSCVSHSINPHWIICNFVVISQAPQLGEEASPALFWKLKKLSWFWEKRPW